MSSAVRRSPGAPSSDRSTLVRFVTDQVATRLVEAIEADETGRADGPATGATPLTADARRQQIMVGAWLSDELATVNQDRMHRGEPPLSEMADREIRSRVVAELTGTGPLERFMTDQTIEEIDVNSHLSTWITYADGRKTDVGSLWDSSADLTAYQKRLARRMTGTGEGRLDTQSPMLTFQADDGSRVVMVLGGRGEHGISTHPRIAIRRFVLRHEGLDGLARRGLFPPGMVPRLRAMVRCGFTILVSGPPGAGKTTLLTELLGEVSERERIITVEKNLLELRLEDDPRHPDAPALFTRHSNAEGEGEITTRQLVELTRRLNPDRVVVGELVEDEALDMLDVASMCKRGSLATIHAHAADVVVQRLAYYVSKSNTRLPEFAVWSLIAETVDFIVHIDLVRNEEGNAAAVRQVTSIIEIGGLGESGGLSTTEVFGMPDATELVQIAPLSHRHMQRLRLAGYDPHLFQMGAMR